MGDRSSGLGRSGDPEFTRSEPAVPVRTRSNGTRIRRWIVRGALALLLLLFFVIFPYSVHRGYTNVPDVIRYSWWSAPPDSTLYVTRSEYDAVAMEREDAKLELEQHLAADEETAAKIKGLESDLARARGRQESRRASLNTNRVNDHEVEFVEEAQP